MSNFSVFLRERRKSLHRTQQDIADQLNVSNKAVSKWERGESFPDPSLLVPLADVLGCTVDELMRGQSKKPEKATVAAPASSEDFQRADAPKPWKKYIFAALCCALSGTVVFFLFLQTFDNGYPDTDIWALCILLFFLGTAAALFLVAWIVYCVSSTGRNPKKKQ